MNHLHNFATFLLESIIVYDDAFSNIITRLSQSTDPIIKEVASELLTKSQLLSKKYNKSEYHIEPSTDGFVLFNNQKVKLGKLLRQLLPDLKLFKIEQFVEVYKSETNEPSREFTTKIYEGDQIIAGYKTSNYTQTSFGGDLNSSCMNNKTSELELYTTNANINLAVCLDKIGAICARSLVWNCTNGKRYYDRIYYREIRQREALRLDLAEMNINPLPTKAALSVSLENIPDELPYVDNFRYLLYNTLSTVFEDGNKILDRTDGGYSGGGYSGGGEDHDSPTSDEEMRSFMFNYYEEKPEEGFVQLIEDGVTVDDIIKEFIDDDMEITTEIRYHLLNGINDLQYSINNGNDVLSHYSQYINDFCADEDERFTAYKEQNKLDMTNGFAMLNALKAVYGVPKITQLIEYIVDCALEEMSFSKFVTLIYQSSGMSRLTEIIMCVASQHEVATYITDNLDDIWNTFYYLRDEYGQ